MREIIISKLDEIEKANNLTMLFACESGSRGWEFPSPDSDYDVRFIYIKPRRFYLSVLDKPDSISFPINDELDVYGWDIRKVLRLIGKSNTTPFEWLQSPIIYRHNQDFKENLWDLCQHFFSARANIHHYLGIAKGALETMLDDEIKIKKLFYVLRPLLAAKWCLEKQSIAPMTIGPLLTLLPLDLKNLVIDLIEMKSRSAEGFVIKVDNNLRNYIDTEFAGIDDASKSLGKEHFDVDKLDTFFIQTLEEHDY